MTARDKCPAHYCFSDLQPWDVIDAWGLDYYLGNVLKYICRAGRKSPDRLVDLNKALHYLQKEVELAEEKLERSSRFPSDLKRMAKMACEMGKTPKITCPICGNAMDFSDEEPWLFEYKCRCGAKVLIDYSLSEGFTAVELEERALAESSAFSNPRKTMEDTMEENTEDSIPSRDTEPWHDLKCPACGRKMVVSRWGEERGALEYRCTCGAIWEDLLVRINETPEKCPYCGSENTSSGNGDHVCLDCKSWWEEDDD